MSRDRKGIALRRTVTRRLDHFFAAWLEHLAIGSARIWSRVEGAVRDSATHKRDETQDATGMQTSPPMRVSMQQQPVQQQQQRKTEEEK